LFAEGRAADPRIALQEGEKVVRADLWHLACRFASQRRNLRHPQNHCRFHLVAVSRRQFRFRHHLVRVILRMPLP